MSDLAFNLNGDPFEVPSNAVGWRVRRMKAKGAPEVVYGRNGQPLVMPLEADLDDVRAEVGTAGRYRFDPVDDKSRPIEGAPAGYIYVHEAGAMPSSTAPLTPRSAPSDNVAIEAMRMNAEMARSIIDRFPQMMEAAATLLRAADGAGLPSREPRATDASETEDDEAKPAPGFDLNALIAQLVPMIIMSFGSGKAKLPELGAVLDWRKASAKKEKPANVTTATKEATAPAEAPTVSENAMDVLPPIEPHLLAHFMAIQSALKPHEAAIARDVAGDLGAAELRAWFDELSKLSVPGAVQRIRALIENLKGGAS